MCQRFEVFIATTAFGFGLNLAFACSFGGSKPGDLMHCNVSSWVVAVNGM